MLGAFSLEKEVTGRNYEGRGKSEQEVVVSSSVRIKGYQTQQVAGSVWLKTTVPHVACS